MFWFKVARWNQNTNMYEQVQVDPYYVVQHKISKDCQLKLHLRSLTSANESHTIENATTYTSNCIVEAEIITKQRIVDHSMAVLQQAAEMKWLVSI